MNRSIMYYNTLLAYIWKEERFPADRNETFQPPSADCVCYRIPRRLSARAVFRFSFALDPSHEPSVELAPLHTMHRHTMLGPLV